MECKQVIVVRKDLNMRKGKIAAQVAHAAMMFLLKGNNIYTFGREHFIKGDLDNEQFEWLSNPESAMAKVVVGVDSEAELQQLIAYGRKAGLTVHEIIDAGRTEFDGQPTLTCAAFGPHEVTRFEGVTNHLKLI